jgi:uncharacterized protein (DUF2461 family)
MDFYDGLEEDNSKSYWLAHNAGAELVGLVGQARRSGWEITAHDALKSAPRGYPKDHPRLELLRLKGLIGWEQWPVAPWLATPKAGTRVTTFLRGAQPLNSWLATHVGAGSG